MVWPARRNSRRWPTREDADRRTEYAIITLRRLPYREYLRTAHWGRVRALALERARDGCALCPAITTLQVHHRSYARKGFEQPENVAVLCDECHGRHHGTLALAAVRAMDQPPLKASLPVSSMRWMMRGA